MTPLTFVSHLPIQPSGGGLYAVTWNMHRQLQRFFSLDVQQVPVPIDRWEQLKSRACRRVLGWPGSFFQFSRKALARTAANLTAMIPRSSEAVFFRSSTRWIQWRPDRPYFVHTDVCFHSFFHNTFAPADFRESDLRRIFETEAAFLDRANAVFFESIWGLEKTRAAYGLSGHNFFQSRIAGGLDAPTADLRSPDGTFRLLTMAKHFRQKGGDLVQSAYEQLKPKYPQLTWHILGGPPDAAALQLPDVHYEGFLKPQEAADLARLRELLSQADLLVHPTREDVNPLVLVEAASFGCPAISVRAFAIPELIEDGVTGILLQQPADGPGVAAAIELFLRDPELCRQFRTAARSRAVNVFSWDAIGRDISETILLHLGRRP